MNEMSREKIKGPTKSILKNKMVLLMENMEFHYAGAENEARFSESVKLFTLNIINKE